MCLWTGTLRFLGLWACSVQAWVQLVVFFLLSIEGQHSRIEGQRKHTKRGRAVTLAIDELILSLDQPAEPAELGLVGFCG